MHTPQTTVIFILVFACFHCNSAEILPQLHKLCLTLDIEKGMVKYISFILPEYPPCSYYILLWELYQRVGRSYMLGWHRQAHNVNTNTTQCPYK